MKRYANSVQIKYLIYSYICEQTETHKIDLCKEIEAKQARSDPKKRNETHKSAFDTIVLL